jgi:hypothetical protein
LAGLIRHLGDSLLAFGDAFGNTFDDGDAQDGSEATVESAVFQFPIETVSTSIYFTLLTLPWFASFWPEDSNYTFACRRKTASVLLSALLLQNNYVQLLAILFSVVVYVA